MPDQTTLGICHVYICMTAVSFVRNMLWSEDPLKSLPRIYVKKGYSFSLHMYGLSNLFIIASRILHH
ncbi:hypothetical protein BGX38DRAFT_1191036 [Terfezia claveryi]|nr:hypothetical protein BGX38DRAFT_1191036 [Terfezia claveryi]